MAHGMIDDIADAGNRPRLVAGPCNGFIYLISNHDTYPGWYKIGRTKNPVKRMYEYRKSMPTIYADCWEIHGLWRVNKLVAAEAHVLKRVRRWRFTLDKEEWFKGGTNDGRQLAKFIGGLLAEQFDGVLAVAA